MRDVRLQVLTPGHPPMQIHGDDIKNIAAALAYGVTARESLQWKRHWMASLVLLAGTHVFILVSGCLNIPKVDLAIRENNYPGRQERHAMPCTSSLRPVAAALSTPITCSCSWTALLWPDCTRLPCRGPTVYSYRPGPNPATP